LIPRPDRAGLGALALYAALAFLVFGRGLVTGPGSRYSGTGRDPQVFIWSFAWWPHAILHALNPFVTHAVWYPNGFDLMWTTAVPGLALPFAPLTLAAGAVASYNVAAVLMPALAAWTAFLLCRHLTGKLWPSLAGGYLFGFSSFMLGQELGHMQMTSVFLVPLAVLVVLQYVEGELGGRALVLRLGPLLALQLLFSTEVAFTLTLALACSLVVGFAAAPAARRRLVESIAPLVGAYVLAAVLTAPFVYYLLAGFHGEPFHHPSAYNTDLLNFVVPTRLTLAGLGWADSIARRFPGNVGERGAYLGWPALVIVALFARERLRTAGGRFLLASLAVAALAALGFELVVDGNRVVQLPWARFGNGPLFDNVLPERLSLWVSLAVAVIVALWAAAGGGLLRRLLPALAILAIVPYATAGTWDQSYAVPRLFTDGSYRSCFAQGERVLPLPPTSAGDSNLWQVLSGFRFAMTGGYVGAGPPASFLTSAQVAWIAAGNPVPPGRAQMLRIFIGQKGVTSVVVDRRQIRHWAAALDRIATPRHVGGVVLYRIAGSTPGCPAR